ncbi:hypothetical protein NP233_g7374 [Leucocoprinus birnbaumii]|uniref:Uncharacterized protein n=1 Tax=Leucocoprinus birnbaumii TaxID=56174 RepID=A0AAD5YQ17_9AGAR|nr:hypothetical protein NP233_g7374 [Leucocoprinus birnbaumii]
MQAFNLISFICISSVALLAGAAPATTTVTLYGVPPPQGDSGLDLGTGLPNSVSQIGVGKNGETTYVAVGVATQEILLGSGTVSVIPTTTTLTETFVEDSKGVTQVAMTTVASQTLIASVGCNFEGTTRADCVAAAAVGSETVLATTYVATPVPIQTLTVASSGIRSLGNGGTLGMSGVTVAGLVTGALMVIGLIEIYPSMCSGIHNDP